MRVRSSVIIPIILIVGLVCGVILFTKKSYHSDNHPILHKVRENFSKLNPEFAKIPLQESSDGAYTENKTLITLCLKNPYTNQYYDMNTIMYVALHELAHVVSKTHGHNEEFKRNFKKILDDAEKVGIFNKSLPITNNYCGMND